MPQFLTRQSNLQQQPQAAQLPFSQFGGQRGPLQGDTTGGIAFPDAGQAQPQAQPNQNPLFPFLLPTGLSSDELDALLGKTKQDAINAGTFQPAIPGTFQIPQLSAPTQPQPSSIPQGGIPIEGSVGFDKFNPIGAGGLNPNKLGGGF